MTRIAASLAASIVVGTLVACGSGNNPEAVTTVTTSETVFVDLSSPPPQTEGRPIPGDLTQSERRATRSAWSALDATSDPIVYELLSPAGRKAVWDLDALLHDYAIRASEKQKAARITGVLDADLARVQEQTGG